MLLKWVKCTYHVLHCLLFNVCRSAVHMADIFILAQKSSPQMNVPVLHTFLMLYRHPNRLQGLQEVGLNVFHVDYMLVYVFFT